MELQKDDPSRPFNACYDIQVKKDTHGGTGSFATRSVDLKAVIFNTDSNFRVNVLNDARSRDTCCHCLVGHDENGAEGNRNIGLKALKICSGCKTVRYCSTQCQKSSWTEVHKHECKMFKKLHPKVLPSNVRAVVRMLIGDDVEGSYLEEILSLQDHLSDLQESGGQRWQDLCLSAKAAKFYSGTNYDEATVLRLFCTLQTNSFTMVNPTYDPIGVALHPNLGRLNHSCDYNATVRFGKYGNAEVIPIRSLGAGEEILISYVDELLPYNERQAELKDRYFFICQCRRCQREATAPNLPRSPAKQNAYDAAIEILAATSSGPDTITSTLSALHEVKWESASYPMPSLRQQLITAYLSEGSYSLAFVHAMVQSFLLDPVLYPVSHHPVRKVHAWLCVRIMDQLLDASVGTVPRTEIFSLSSFNIDISFWQYATVVSLHRSATVVAPGDFSKMVDARYNENRAQWTGSEKAYQEQYTGKEILKIKWTQVQAAIDSIMSLEKKDEVSSPNQPNQAQGT